jgi:hypothetical protein
MKPGGLIWPVPTKVFVDLLLSLVVTAYRTCRANTRSALLEMYVLRSSSASTVPFPRSSVQTLQTQCSPCI